MASKSVLEFIADFNFEPQTAVCVHTPSRKACAVHLTHELLNMHFEMYRGTGRPTALLRSETVVTGL